jgi:hypothetical protein
MSTAAALQPLDNTKGIPVDPNVRIPDSVTARGKEADELHKRLYAKPTPVEAAPASPPAETPPQAPQTAQTPPQEPKTPPQTAQTPPPEALKPGDENVSAEDWRHRFLSMQGRFNAQKVTIGSMETQMAQLGAELQHVQNQLAAFNQGMPTASPTRTGYMQNTPPDHEKLITDQDRQDYGDELIDLARRAGREAVQPELQRLHDENQRLTQQVKSTAKRELFAYLDGKLPQWRQINRDTRFKTWLRLPNIYTRQIRNDMLNAAVDGADAPLVLQFFHDFLREAHATGQTAQTQQTEQQAPLAAPRSPAVALETLAAPGRAKPASGESAVPSEKPIYTRAQISKFYEDSRKGYYDGRKAEYDAIQADLSAAQREGRIR